MTLGLSPRSGDELNNQVGMVLRQFTESRAAVHQSAGWVAANDLTAEPYNLTSADAALISSAFADLDTALQAIDMTFISRITGIWS